MKISFMDRVLVALQAFLSVVLACMFALRAFGVDLAQNLYTGLEAAAGSVLARVIIIGICVIYALLSTAVLTLVCRRYGKGGGFVIIDSGDGGQIRVAYAALEQMVRQAVDQVVAGENVKIAVKGEDESINIDIRMNVAAGEHVPTVTFALRQRIREFVERNCGIAVRSVGVTVEALDEGQVPVAAPAQVALEAPANQAAPAVLPQEETLVLPAQEEAPEVFAQAQDLQPEQMSAVPADVRAEQTPQANVEISEEAPVEE